MWVLALSHFKNWIKKNFKSTFKSWKKFEQHARRVIWGNTCWRCRFNWVSWMTLTGFIKDMHNSCFSLPKQLLIILTGKNLRSFSDLRLHLNAFVTLTLRYQILELLDFPLWQLLNKKASKGQKPFYSLHFSSSSLTSFAFYPLKKPDEKYLWGY